MGWGGQEPGQECPRHTFSSVDRSGWESRWLSVGWDCCFLASLRLGMGWDWLKQVSEWNSFSIVEGRLTGWVPHVGKHSERMPGRGCGGDEDCRGPSLRRAIPRGFVQDDK